MDKPEASGEPSMEEILASIRKIIAEEPSGSRPTPETAAKAALGQASGAGADAADEDLPAILKAPAPQEPQEKSAPLLGRIAGALRGGTPGLQARDPKSPPGVDADISDLLEDRPSVGPATGEAAPGVSVHNTAWRHHAGAPPAPQAAVGEREIAPYAASGAGRPAPSVVASAGMAFQAATARGQPAAPAAPQEAARDAVDAKPIDFGAIVPRDHGGVTARPAPSALPQQPTAQAAQGMHEGRDPARSSGTPGPAPSFPSLFGRQLMPSGPPPEPARTEPSEPVVIAAMPETTQPKPAPASTPAAPVFEAPSARSTAPKEAAAGAVPSGAAPADVQNSAPATADNPIPSPAAAPTSAAAALGALAAGLAASVAKPVVRVVPEPEPRKPDVGGAAERAPAAPIAEPGAPAPEPAKIVAAPAPVAVRTPSAPASTAPAAVPIASVSPPAVAAAGRSFEDTVVELLRPMLRQWLDENMPRIVEKALRMEIAADATPKAKQSGA